MPDISSSLSKREVNARQNTYTKSEIDLKDGAIQAIAEAAQTTADAAEKKNQEQDQLIAELQKSAHTHSNKGVLDKIEQPYTTAERDKLAGLENYTHPNYTAHAKGFYKVANDGKGHVTDAGKVTKKDITDLGIPGEDTNTTYELALPTYASQKEPPAPMLSLNGSDGSENKQTIPCAYTVLDDIVYKEFSGFKIGGKYQSVADLAFVIPRSARIYPWRITAYISLETPSGSTYIHLHYTLEITDEGSSIRRYQGNGKYYSGKPCTTNDWAILSDLQNFSNPDRDVWLYRIGVPDNVFSKLTNAYCKARLVYQTGKNGDVVKPVSYYTDITFDETVHAMDTNLVYVLTKADVSDVAFTGSYNDLANKPTIPDVSGKQDKSTAVTHTANTAVGSATKPVYIAANGAATAIAHSINSDVPANAEFTDTTYPIKWVTIDANFAAEFRTETKGDTAAGGFLSGLRCDTANVTGAPQYGSGIAWGKADTHGYLYVMYNKAEAYLGGGNADRLQWIKQISFDGHTHRDLDQIGNVGYYGSNEANTNGWYKIYSGKLTGFNDHVARLSVVRGFGYGHGTVLVHLRCNNGSSIVVQDLVWETRYNFSPDHIAIKTNGNEYGIYVYQTVSQYGRIKVRVLENCGTSSNWTMTLSNNSTKESSFTPTATGKDGSTVAKAKEADTLTDSGWVDVSNFKADISSFSQITTSFRKYGDIVFIRGRVQPKSNMTSISLCSTTSTSLTGITPNHSVKGVGVSTDGLTPFMVNITTSPANSVILKGSFSANKIYDFEFSYIK